MGLLGAKYDKKVVRRRGSKADIWDDAAEIEDDETGEKKWKFKSDEKEIPSPDESKIGYLFYRKWWQKLLFMPKQRVEYIEYADKGSRDGTVLELKDDKLTSSNDEDVFETHRTIQVRKNVDLYSNDDDNTQMWLAAYLSILVLINLAGMYIITQGVQSGVADAVASGINAGKSAAGDGGASVPGVGMFMVAGQGKIREMKEKYL